MRLAGPIDLAHSLHGGQAFRWVLEEGAFLGAMGRDLVRLRQRDGWEVDAEGAQRDALRSYFRLERADAARRARLARDPLLAPAMRALPGLRLLRQDPWETTVAFLTSANNNVLRIEGIMRRLSSTLGERIEGVHHAFPPSDVVARATESRLRALGLGYRAPFLRQTARMVARGEVDLARLRGRPRQEVREALLALPGVGPKVADCIALFSLDVDDAFPVDRWVQRAMRAVVGEVAPKDLGGLARERWGRDAGLAQQYLFHAVRLREGAPGTRRVSLSPG